MTMIYKSKNKYSDILSILKVCLTLPLFFCVSTAYAQQSQVMSVSPTLFDVKAVPGQTWQSEIRVINSNNFDLTVYVERVNFTPQGESGTPRFHQLDTIEQQGQTLAEWITVTSDSITIPRQQAQTIRFSVTVPNEAPPGGHQAALLIGTQPPVQSDGGMSVQTSQFVTALLFLKVDGEIRETGRIRSLEATSLTQRPDIDVSLRFENTGNVHVLPQGEIEIFNMWGQSRGLIPVNQRTQFGKVLRETTREYTFRWQGDVSFFDIGRYTARATVGYGEGTKKFDSATTHFWLIPYTAISLIVGGFIVFLYVISWAIKAYIRKMLFIAGVDPRYRPTYHEKFSKANDPNAIVIANYSRSIAPVRVSMVELRTGLMSARSWRDYASFLKHYVYSIRKALLVMITILTFSILMHLVFVNGRESDRAYNITINNEGREEIVNSEEVFFQQLEPLRKQYLRELSGVDTTSLSVSVVNVSGSLGQGARVGRLIESFGLPITEVTYDFSSRRERTVVVYRDIFEDLALGLSRELGNSLVSRTNEASEFDIIIYIGSDY